jgi:AcrR family transcriptional regulator
MARAAKRNTIILQSANLFLAEGFKGTTIDLVCRECGVSKPTVYKYFPDKSVLFAEVMTTWLLKHPVIATSASQWPDLKSHLSAHWWTPEIMAMYRLVLAEGWRFPVSADAFWRQCDQAWWSLIDRWVAQAPTQDPIKLWVQAELWAAITPQRS